MHTCIALLMAIGAAAAHGLTTQAPDVIVYVHDATMCAAVAGSAELQARRILAAAGIAVEFRSGTSIKGGPFMAIDAVFQEQSALDFKPGALAYATLGVYSGNRIVVLADRVNDAPLPLRTALLAHTLAHEITHVLEGVSRHSSTGLMKSHWDAGDYRAMRSAPLPFAPEDLMLLRQWSERRHESGRALYLRVEAEQ